MSWRLRATCRDARVDFVVVGRMLLGRAEGRVVSSELRVCGGSWPWRSGRGPEERIDYLLCDDTWCCDASLRCGRWYGPFDSVGRWAGRGRRGAVLHPAGHPSQSSVVRLAARAFAGRWAGCGRRGAVLHPADHPSQSSVARLAARAAAGRWAGSGRLESGVVLSGPFESVVNGPGRVGKIRSSYVVRTGVRRMPGHTAPAGIGPLISGQHGKGQEARV